MKQITFLWMSLCVMQFALADQFQFKLVVPAGTSYAAYAHVRLLDGQNQTRFEGDADRYGRINITAARGNYQAVVSVNGQSKKAPVTLTGATTMRLISLR